MPPQWRHASAPTHRFPSFSLVKSLNSGLMWMLRPEAQGAQTPLHPGKCSSSPCSLGCPAHHLLMSTVLWSLATDRQGRETWGFECLTITQKKNKCSCMCECDQFSRPCPFRPPFFAPSVVTVHALHWVRGFSSREK